MIKHTQVPPRKLNAFMTPGNIIASPPADATISIVTIKCSHVLVFLFIPINENIYALHGAYNRVAPLRTLMRKSNFPISIRQSFEFSMAGRLMINGGVSVLNDKYPVNPMIKYSISSPITAQQHTFLHLSAFEFTSSFFMRNRFTCCPKAPIVVIANPYKFDIATLFQHILSVSPLSSIYCGLYPTTKIITYTIDKIPAKDR